MSRLIQLCGLPGSGKSTWAAAHANGARVVTADEIREGARPGREFLILWNRAKKELREGRDVIVDTCALRAIDRSQALGVGRQFNARCELVVFCTPVSLCRARNSMRRAPALVDWRRYAAHAASTMESIGFEGWDHVDYVPKRDPLAFVYK
jgi:predicted kinase